jgi:uncharacterized protein YbjT (DUF2867 family)/ligand-binding SRPBCC domain-containing protein
LYLPPSVEKVQADVFDPLHLEEALRGVDVAYYFIHSMEKAAPDKGTFVERDERAAVSFCEAAANARIKRIVYLGGLGETQDDLSPHLASRMKVGEILQSGKVPATVFRAAIVVGPEGTSFKMMEVLVRRLPVMICPRWVDTLCQPIAIEDAIHYLVHCLEIPETAGRTYDIGGPEVLSYHEMLLKLAEVLGLRRKIFRVPLMTPRLSSAWVHWVTPVPSYISRPLIDGLKNSVVCRDRQIDAVIPHTCLDYESSLKQALWQEGLGKVSQTEAGYRLNWRQWVPYSPEQVMDFLGDLSNLGRMTPDSLAFRLEDSHPQELAEGTRLRYRFRIGGLPVRWRSEIVSWDFPKQFEDVQNEGPYKKWHHTHLFSRRDGGTLVEDIVDYSLPLGILGRVAHPFVVQRLLKKIFRYRSLRFVQLLREKFI